MRLQEEYPGSAFLFTNKSQFMKEMSNLEKLSMWEQVQETVGYINKINNNPEYGVILGSGLGSFEDINVEFILRYNDIPNFPVSTVQGHKGALVFGTIGEVVARPFSFYEGIP
jgi:purine-nucleoside phosphorylase